MGKLSPHQLNSHTNLTLTKLQTVLHCSKVSILNSSSSNSSTIHQLLPLPASSMQVLPAVPTSNNLTKLILFSRWQLQFLNNNNNLTIKLNSSSRHLLACIQQINRMLHKDSKRQHTSKQGTLIKVAIKEIKLLVTHIAPCRQLVGDTPNQRKDTTMHQLLDNQFPRIRQTVH